MGQEARNFVDFLAQSGHSCWQVLPLGPTSYGDSPYQAFSTFAGNHYFIDFDDLAAEGLLEPGEYQSLDWGSDPQRVDYGLAYQNRRKVLALACRRLMEQRPQEVEAFAAQHAFWLEDYALFMALKDLHQGAPWQKWPEPLRRRQPQDLEEARRSLAGEVAFWRGVQYLFFRQWSALKQRANEKGIAILGDLPIYVSLDSSDVWASPEQFQLDETLTPTEVAGCPPDAFSEDGQLWGNPLFRWDRMKEDGYRWWIARIEAQFRLCDMLRIDHFRGFDEYYAIPFGAENAKEGQWRKGPGMELFHAVTQALGPREIVAEDLGFLTPSVGQLLEESGYPGMKVMEFGFGLDGGGSEYLPHNHVPNCVVYTGTHDNDTILGWMDTLSPRELDYVRDYLRLTPEEGYHWGMIRAAWGSVAQLVVIQAQDLLGLGSEGRINIPSTAQGNWQWRLRPGQLDAALAEKIYRDLGLYQRRNGLEQ